MQLQKNVFQVSYELAIILALLLFVVAPIHGVATKHFNIARTIDNSHAEFFTDGKTAFETGDKLPVYRFHNGCKMPVGWAVVERTEKEKVHCLFDPARFRWPMGRHGRIIQVLSPKEVRIDIGSSLDLRSEDILIVFEGRRPVGKIRLRDVFGSASVAEVLEGRPPFREGQTVSEYTVATQVVLMKNTFLSFFEILLIVVVVLLYFWIFLTARRSPLIILGCLVRDYFKKNPCVGLKYAFHLGAGVFFVWFVVKFLAIAVSHYVFIFTQFLAQHGWSSGPVVSLKGWFLSGPIAYIYTAAGFIYFDRFFRYGRSPILDFWHLFRYRSAPSRWLSKLDRKAAIWLMHLVIAYAFAANLLFFLKNNVTEIVALAWPSTTLRITGNFNLFDPTDIFSSISDLVKIIGYVLTHRPDYWTFPIACHVFRYTLWSVTVIGCVIGYGHSILSILWGKHIRNLDFTVMGWLSNGFCYPLFGVLIWQLVPSFVGLDPIITNGPWYYFMLSWEFILNLLYTVSIWNLGKMFGVMTDKGVRTTAFYSVVRHPNYTLEVPMFLAVEMIGFSTLVQWVSIMMYVWIYYIRSEREDHFMSVSNPDYLVYKERTRYKFIPGVY